MTIKNLNKYLFLAASILVSAALTSCEPSGGEASQTISYPALNYISPIDGSTPILTGGVYTFSFNYTEQKESVSTSFNADNSNYTVTTDQRPYEDLSPAGGMGLYAGNFAGTINNHIDLSNCAFYLSSFPVPSGMEYVPSKLWIPVITEKDANGKETSDYHPGAMYRPGYGIPPIVVGKYRVGAIYDVVTCSTDMSFFGTTTTTYPTGKFVNEGMIYRLFIDIKKKTVDVVIYNAKFAEQAPSLSTIYLPSLPLTLKNGNYEINATNIVPKVPEGEGAQTVLIDYPNYTFNTFRMETVPGSLMSEATIEYTVATAFKGSFTGKYVSLPDKMKN